MEDYTVSSGLPPAQGLYDPRFEHDACGIGFVANIKGQKSHDIIVKGIQVLINLTHRGACGCDPETGDGAGVLIQIPHKFFARECESLGFALPVPGEYAVGITFLPVEKHPRLNCEGVLERIIREEGLSVLGWRDTPVNGDAIGRVARASQPYIQQIFVARPPEMDEDAFERKLYVVRKRAELEIAESDIEDKDFFYVPSLSCRTIVYKGLLLAPQIANFYGDLSDPDAESALCLVHQRFSTNTFPSWKLAHPYRYVAHNGEINTLKGNVAWMHARQSILDSPLFGDDIKKLFPIIEPGGSVTLSGSEAIVAAARRLGARDIRPTVAGIGWGANEEERRGRPMRIRSDAGAAIGDDDAELGHAGDGSYGNVAVTLNPSGRASVLSEPPNRAARSSARRRSTSNGSRVTRPRPSPRWRWRARSTSASRPTDRP